jgi:hypothetical protein
MDARALSSVPRGWWGVRLPGFRDAAAAFATYSAFADRSLSPIERELDDSLTWLGEQSVVPESLADNPASPEPTRAANGAELKALSKSDLRVPASFAAFIGEPELRTRVRSCTACYLDLADATVSAPEGLLIHFLSDQQWMLHWLLYVGEDGTEAVVATNIPYGFEGEAPATLAGKPDPAEELATIVCAESFNEFLYHFWMENEVWFALRYGEPLTDEQRRYAEHYRTGV